MGEQLVVLEMNAENHCQISEFFKMTMTQTHCQCRRHHDHHGGTLSVMPGPKLIRSILIYCFPFPWIKYKEMRYDSRLSEAPLLLFNPFSTVSFRILQTISLLEKWTTSNIERFYCFGVFGVIVRDIVVTREGAKSQGRAIHPTKCQLCDIHTKDTTTFSIERKKVDRAGKSLKEFTFLSF